MIEAFRIACRRGLEGWELHLVGGCKAVDRAYAEEARTPRSGCPFASTSTPAARTSPSSSRRRRCSGTRLVWARTSATHPDRFEHFGITVVEAMSAGAVPVVYAQGGPAAIIDAAECGEVFSTIDELATATVALVHDDARLERLAATRAPGP